VFELVGMGVGIRVRLLRKRKCRLALTLQCGRNLKLGKCREDKGLSGLRNQDRSPERV
jgi:hypothetical protein